MKRIFQISFLVITLSFTIESCTKDVLPDDTNEPIIEYDSLVGLAEGLEGSWEWLYSSGPGGTKYPNFYYSSPQTEGYTLSLTFRKDGTYEKYKNGNLFENGGITYILYQQDTLWNISMTFIHDGPIDYDKDFNVAEIIQNDTLDLSHYPFDYQRVNLFVRR